MKMILEFDIDADIVDVPQSVIDNRETMRKRFLKWIYNKNQKHKYWVKIQTPEGKEITGVCYRGEAFVEWLNKKELLHTQEKASVVQEHIIEYPDDLPRIAF